ncbi:major facilitator superfamily protein [Klebsormidium nitens]|uniref:Major facilitator superfamily protein n=1 Tax=Klebsormidium nitens TaxID=105231 RepID=A0A0U9I7N0_KLENI|nr:major facilitator superfamily protein [Klebsormidium nitens]|eukprot:GAQ85466.1 major facilitator superfamily protein [Klebsormidium nitens]
MVQFGHQLVAQRVPGWENHYIDYKTLKKKIKEFRPRRITATEDEMAELIREFAESLDYQVEKVVLFFIQEQGQLAEHLIELQHTKETTFKKNDMAQVAGLMDDYRHVGYELLRLLRFVKLNLTGLRKIIKKFEKNLGVRVMEQYVASRGQGPYSQLQQLFRTTGVGALVGAMTRNLEELRTQQLMPHRTTSFALFRRATLAPPSEDEPVLREIQEEREQLAELWNFQRFTAVGLLIDLETPMQHRDVDLTPEEEAERFHVPSLYINLACTFFYMVNYYIIVPTSDDYAVLLHMPASVAGIMIGAMPLTALVSTFVYSAWSNRSYREPLIVSTIILIIGNIFYALALVFNSVWLVLLGRAFNGLGGARAINRRYIADWVPVKQRTQASAAFVSASAFGMAAGPAMAGLMTSLDFRIPFLPGRPIVVNDVTAPGWIMTLWWALFLVAVFVFFKEPHRPDPTMTPSHSSANLTNAKRPLLLPDPPEVESGAASDGRGSEFGSEEEVEAPAKTLAEVWREMNSPVLVTLLVYFMLKFATEVLISESSIVTKYYFRWTPRSVGAFLSVLGLTVLPVNYLIGSFIGNVYEDRLVIMWTEVITVVGVVLNLSYEPLIPYSLPQYVAGAILIFVATCALEGVNMALLSKTMSPRLSKGTYNCGLLSTEAGTLARAISDIMITAMGGFGQKYILNLTMLPTLVVASGTTIVTFLKYRSLKTAL